MPDEQVNVFFYGLFMDEDLLRSKGVEPLNPRPAALEGYGLRIGTRATLVPSKDERSYGMIMGLTRHELEELYSGPGLEQYRPETVTCTTFTDEPVAALCYNLPRHRPPAKRTNNMRNGFERC